MTIAVDASVLVIIVARIGDTLLVTPALRAIKEAAPQGVLTCLAHSARIDVLKNLPFIDKLGEITPRSATWRGRLSGMRWEYAIVYGHDAELVRYALRVADRVVAFEQSDAALNHALYCAVPTPMQMHAVHERLLLPAALDVIVRDFRLAYSPTIAEINSARELLDRLSLAGNEPLIGLQPSSFPSKSYRDWPLEHFSELCSKILSVYPRAHFLLLGGSADRARVESLQVRFPSAATALAGRLALRETAALMSLLDLYIGVDTGPTHLAGALEIPMVALYHCRHRGQYLAPLRDKVAVIEHPAEKEICTPQTPMSAIAVEVVWERVAQLLGGTL